MLERALAESPPPDLHPELLAELGQAELSAGLRHAPDRLGEAIELTSDPARQAQLVLVQAQALSAQARHREAAEVVASALDDLGDDEPAAAAQLEIAYVKTVSLVPDRFDDAWRRGTRLLARLDGPPTLAQREAIAHLAGQRSVHGGERAEILTLAELAWGDGALLESADTAVGLAWPMLTGALLVVDGLERALEICDAVVAETGAVEPSGGYPAASYCRTWPLYESGRIDDALAEARAALDASPEPVRGYVRTAYGAVASCQIQRGELEQAERALSAIDQPEIQGTMQFAFLLDVRAQLRLAQLRPADALEDALSAGRMLDSDCFGGVSPGAVSWRLTAALARLALGEAGAARELAAEELELAGRLGITRVVIRALRVLGLAERGERGIELLTEAVEAGEGRPPRLEHIHAMIDLGAALRRANRRSAARQPLRRALERSHEGGVTTLEQRARRELAEALRNERRG
jgi:tetratricopeptide (TPR) repeat protein